MCNYYSVLNLHISLVHSSVLLPLASANFMLTLVYASDTSSKLYISLFSYRTSFFYNPALQSRSFLMLGVISQSDSASTLLITKTLKVLEETMLRHEGDVVLLEAIIICLTRLVPQLDEVCEVGVCVLIQVPHSIVP